MEKLDIAGKVRTIAAHFPPHFAHVATLRLHKSVQYLASCDTSFHFRHERDPPLSFIPKNWRPHPSPTSIINTLAAMNKLRAAISLDRAALAAVTLGLTLTMGEAYTRTSLVDADSAKEARYPPLSSIITEGEFVSSLMYR